MLNEKGMNFLKEFVKTVIYVSLVVILVRYFIIQPFVVVGHSMEPTFHENDYLFVNELSYNIGSPQRGDVIVFRYPGDNQCAEFINDSNFFTRTFFSNQYCTDFIKRIVGMPNDTVIIENGKVEIKNSNNPSGIILNENYINNVSLEGRQKIELDNNEYFVLGDNRLPNASSDSRNWGSLEEEYIIGKAWLKIMPFGDFGFISSPEYGLNTN